MHAFNGEYLVIAVASSAPPILNPSALIQPRFAKSPVATPALAIMNLTVWSFPPTLRFITDLQSTACAIMDAEMVRPRCPKFTARLLGVKLRECRPDRWPTVLQNSNYWECISSHE